MNSNRKGLPFLVAVVLVVLLLLGFARIASTQAQDEVAQRPPVQTPVFVEVADNNWSVFIPDVCVVDGMPRIFSASMTNWDLVYQNNVGEVWGVKVSSDIISNRIYVSQWRYYGGEAEGYFCPDARAQG